MTCGDCGWVLGHSTQCPRLLAVRKSWTCRGAHHRLEATGPCLYCGAPPTVAAGKAKSRGRKHSPESA